MNTLSTALPLNRKDLSRFVGYFFAGNMVLFWLIGWQYLLNVTPLTFNVANPLYTGIIWAFLVLAFLGQFALLAFLPYALTVLLTYLFPHRIVIKTIAIIFGTCATLLLIIDSFIFKHYHFHLNGIVMQMVFSSEEHKIFDFTWLELLIIVAILSALLLLQICYANIVWRRVRQGKKFFVGKRLAVSLSICLFLSYMMFLLSNAQPISLLAQQSQALPLYNPILAALLPIQDSLAKINSVGAGNINQAPQTTAPLHYPLAPLVCHAQQKPMNVLIIALDAWRFDMVNPTVMPHVSQFAQQSWQYTNHWSGGNATRPGIFSLFYGLPATYWTTMLQQKQGPVLLHEFLQQHYQLGVFVSAGTKYPNFDGTVFSEMSPSPQQMMGKNVIERDKATTQAFENFLQQNQPSQQNLSLQQNQSSLQNQLLQNAPVLKNKQAESSNQPKPFFGFIFYNASHTYCDEGIPATPFQPMLPVCDRFALYSDKDRIPYMNRYKNALYFLDGQVAEVLADLQQRHLLDNTVVILTGDHAEEFNDNHLGYWGHAGNFTRYQVQTPLIIKWPHQAPMIIQQQTTHYDIAPTLLQQVLGCVNPASDYSVGQNLSAASSLPYFIVASYIDFGILEKERITTIYPAGDYAITDRSDHPISGAKLHLDVMAQVFKDNTEFYKKNPL